LELSLGKELSEYWHASTAYNFDISEIFNVREDAAQSIKDEAGKWTTSSISFMIARDTRDNYQDPLSGSRNTYTVAFAGLGGNVAFFRNVFDSQWFFQTGEYSTIRLRGKVGYITSLFNKELPLFQRFYIGGLDTIRGVGYGKAGPLDATTGEARGGEKYAVANVEYIFPIIMEYKFKGVVFVDAGRAWDKGEAWGSDLRYTSGFGIRWHSPFGPIRVEYGFNLNKKPGESAGKVEFGMGSAF
jgi:outer membrane protein insertion porin family